MGDRCYLELTGFAKDKEAYEAIGLRAEGGDGTITDYVDEEANYGLLSEREKLAKEGLIFVGSHGNGGQYCGSAFASPGDGKLYECDAVEGGSLTCEVDDEGEPVPEAIAQIKALIAARKNVLDKFEEVRQIAAAPPS